MAIGFNIQFRVNEKTSSRVIRLTDTSSNGAGFTFGKGNFSIVFPDGTSINHTDFVTPDISSIGSYYEFQAQTDIYNNVLTGQYTVTYVVLDSSNVAQTPVVHTITDFNWIKPKATIQNKSDVFIPEVQFFDATDYVNIGNFIGTVSRTFSVPLPTNSEVAGNTATTTSQTLTPVVASKYYEGLYNLSLDVTVNYTHSTYSWLTIYYTSLTQKTYDVRQVPTQSQIVGKMNLFRADVDSYKEKNDTQFEILSERYDIAVALYSHLIARFNTSTLDGSQPLLEELLSILEPYGGVYVYKATQLTQFDIGVSELGFFYVSNGVNSTKFFLQNTLTFSAGNSALSISVSGNTLTFTPNFNPTGGTAGQILAKIDGANYNTEWIDNYTSQIKHQVKLGESVTAGTAVYVGTDLNSSTNMTVYKASYDQEFKSSKTMGITVTSGSTNDFVYIITEGLLTGINTLGAVKGDPIWLGANGALLFGIANKPVAPQHMVYLGVVTRVNQNNGEIFVKIQNGFELEELHNVLVTSVANGDIIYRDSATNLWKNGTLVASAPLSYNADTRTFSISQAGASTNGYLSSTDWNTFNNKQNALTNPVTGVLTNLYLPIANGTNSLTNSVIRQFSGNSLLGIDTDASVWGLGWYGLQIREGYYSSRSTYSGITAGAYFDSGWKNNIAGKATKIDLEDGDIIFSTAPFASLAGDTIFSQIVLFKNSGNVLIGTATDDGVNKLQINGSIIATSIKKSGGTSSQFLKANGSVDSSSYITLTSLSVSSPITYNSITGVFGITQSSGLSNGYLSSTDWNTFNNKQATVSLTTTGSSGAATFISNVLNVPAYTLSGLGGEPTITAGTTSQYWRGDKTWQTLNTTNVVEGTNLYYTQTRFDSAFTAKSTSNLSEGTNLYFTTARVRATDLSGLNVTGGSVISTDTILQAFGKIQNQLNTLSGSVIYQGVWNASTNTPSLTSSSGTKGYYYKVSVAGSTALDGISDWKVGDWAIYNGTTWDKIDNTDSVSSVNGFTGAVSLTTSNISEGTNLYYTDVRARASLSFVAGSGGYNSTTGVMTIPTNTNQLTNGANFITLTSLSAGAPLSYNNTTGAFSISQASGSTDGYLSSTDWTTFNNKQSALTNPITGTGTINYVPKFTAASALGNSTIYDSGTAVGIKTTSPVASFEVNGASKASGGEILTYTNLNGVSISTDYVGHLVQAADYTNSTTSSAIYNGTISSVGAVGTNTGAIFVTGGSFNARPYSTSSGQVSGTGISLSAIRSNASDISTNSANSLVGATSIVGHTATVNTAITTATVYAYNMILQAPRGTITLGAGQIINARVGVGANNTGVVTTFYGLRTGALVGATSGTGTGTITSYYDLYLEGATIQATGIVTNKWGVYQTNSAHANYFAGAVLIGTTTNAGYALDVTGTFRATGAITGSQYRIAPNGTSQVYNIVDSDATYAGSYSIQAGGGSAGYGGSVVMYGHAHASFAGWVKIGISSGSSGSFVVQNKANGDVTASNLFTITSTGVSTFSSSVTATSFIKSGGTASQYLMADGSVSTLTNPITGSLTTNYIPKATGSTTLGNSLIYDNGTNVGIGTTTLGAKLDVAGNIRTNANFSINNLASDSIASSSYFALINSSNSYQIVQQLDANYGLAFHSYTGTSFTKLMTLTSSGNLGLGVTPSAWSVGKAIELNFPGNGLWNASAVDTRLMTNVYFNGGFYYGSTGTASIMETGNGFIWRTAPSGTAGTAITFTQAMTLNASGRLLLGTTTDDGSSRLQVTGGGTFSSTLTSGALLTSGTSGSGGQEALRIYNNNGYIGFFNTANTVRSAYIQGNTTDLTLSTSLANPILFYTSNAEKVRINAGGNVSIGNTNNTYKLDVSGAIRGLNSIIDGANNGNVSTLNFTRTDFSWGIYNQTNLRFYVGTGNTLSPATQVFEIATSGSATFSSSVTATSALINTTSGADTFPLVVQNSLLKANNNYLGFKLQSSDASPLSANFLLQGGASNRYLNIYAYEDTVGFKNVIFGGGNVGIGTTSVGKKLDVLGDIRVKYADNSSNILLQPDFAQVYIVASSADATFGDKKLVINSSGLSLRAMGSTTAAMEIISNGNVLIGTTADAGYKLDVNGISRIYTLVNNNFLTFGYGGTDWYQKITNNDTSSFVISNSSGGGITALRITQAGDSYFTASVNAQTLNLNGMNTAPATSTSTGVSGQIRIDASYIYVCVNTNTWKRVALASF